MYATDDLRHEHEIILHLVDALDGAASRLSFKTEVAIEDLSGMVEAIRTFADSCHHGKEEDCLFPAMERVGMSREMGPIAVMLHEHEAGRRFVRGMLNGLEEIRENGESSQFVNNAVGYADLLRNHIFKENNILFPMAEQALSSDVQRQLKLEFDEIELDRIGEGVHEKIHADVHRWFEKYAK